MTALTECEKQASRERKYEVANAGRRMIEKPDQALIDRVFGGDFERYKQCVIANFGECKAI